MNETLTELFRSGKLYVSASIFFAGICVIALYYLIKISIYIKSIHNNLLGVNEAKKELKRSQFLD